MEAILARNIRGMCSRSQNIIILYIMAMIFSLSLTTTVIDEPKLREVGSYSQKKSISRYSTILVKKSLLVSESAVDKQGELVNRDALTYISMNVSIIRNSLLHNSSLYATFKETVTIDKSSDQTPRIQIEIEANFVKNSSVKSRDVVLYNELKPDLKIDIGPDPLPMVVNYQFLWNFSTIQNFSVNYTAIPTGNSKNLYLTTVNLTEMTTNISESYGLINLSYCLEQKKNIMENPLHELTVLMFFLGIFLAVTLTVFLLLVLVIHRQKSTVTHYSQDCTKHKTLIMTSSKWDYQKVEIGSSRKPDSIVEVLVQPPINTFRQINGWDISSTQFLEKQLENMKCETHTKIPVDLVQEMINRQEISLEAGKNLIKQFRRKTEEFTDNLNKQFESDRKELQKEISLRNKAQLEKLQMERWNALEALQKNYGSRGEMIQLQKEYDDREKDLVIQLELQQKHDMQSLNRDYDVKKRIGLKNMEEDFFNLVKEESSLLLEKHEWLKEESQRKQAEFQKVIDRIAAQENEVLEERHKKHQIIFDISNNQEVDYRHLLMKAFVNQRGILQKLKQDHITSDYENNQLYVELQRISEEFAEKKKVKEKELHLELTREKKQTLDDMEIRHKREVDDLEKQFNEQKDLDELTRMIEMREMKSKQRIELMKTEIELDEKHVQSLNVLRDGIVQDTIAAFQTSLENMIKTVKKPESEGVVDSYLNSYRQDIKDLEKKQQQERQEYNAKVTEKLTENRQHEFSEQSEEQKENLEITNDDKTQVVEELLTRQTSISEENRKKILEEHEMQKMRFEKSLTLNKLRQQSLLEERISKKRRQKLDIIEQQQALAEKEQSQNSNTETNNPDDVTAQPLNINCDFYTADIDQINLSSEVEEVERSLLKERNIAKQEEENKLGEIIARLNLEKAKQICQLDEKARAIDGMKALLLQDSRINSDAESQRIIEKHAENQQKLQQQSEEHKKKFSEELTKKLEMRKTQQETTLNEKHEREIRLILTKAPNKTVAIIKKLVLMNKHVAERVHFINQMNVEIKQNIEDLQHQYDIKIQTDLQKNEIRLIVHLIGIHQIDREEIFQAMKITDQLKNIINDMPENSKESERNSFLEAQIQDIVVKNSKKHGNKEGKNTKYFLLPEKFQFGTSDFIPLLQIGSPNPNEERGTSLPVVQ